MESTTHRDRYPDELAVPPHRQRLHDTPLSDAEVSQREPEQDGQQQSVCVYERHGDAQQLEVVVVWGPVSGEVLCDGGPEGGGEEEGEDEGGECPEGTVEIGGVEVGG
jgi:hypothetical protein